MACVAGIVMVACLATWSLLQHRCEVAGDVIREAVFHAAADDAADDFGDRHGYEFIDGYDDDDMTAITVLLSMTTAMRMMTSLTKQPQQAVLLLVVGFKHGLLQRALTRMKAARLVELIAYSEHFDTSFTEKLLTVFTRLRMEQGP
eukprot:s2960_g3.t1